MISTIRAMLMIGLISFLAAYIAVPLNSGALAPYEKSEPHDFRGHGLDCKSCHATLGLKKRGIMRKPVLEICTGCHALATHTHPFDIKPALEVPADLPLDMNGMITCATCHDPHGIYKDALTGKKTRYLRRAGPGRIFCASCHRNIMQT